MTIFTLKIIALITMIIDHISFLNISLFNNELLRDIGRISFPLYLFCITEGLIYTRNKVKFAINIFIIALISQIPYMLYFDTTRLNVLFTFLFGILLIFSIEKVGKDITYYPLVLIMLLLSLIVNTDYGILGILFTAILYFTKKHSDNKYLIIFVIICFLYLNYNITTYFFYSLISCILIFFYNKKRGYSFKMFFHVSYPLHLIILLLLKIIFI